MALLGSVNSWHYAANSMVCQFCCIRGVWRGPFPPGSLVLEGSGAHGLSVLLHSVKKVIAFGMVQCPRSLGFGGFSVESGKVRRGPVPAVSGF